MVQVEPAAADHVGVDFPTHALGRGDAIGEALGVDGGHRVGHGDGHVSGLLS
jgi:hypothetical protein